MRKDKEIVEELIVASELIVSPEISLGSEELEKQDKPIEEILATNVYTTKF